MSQISVKQLEAFIAVAEYNSFSRAAQALFLSQSTVSSHISELSQTVGHPLFARGDRHNVKLTSEGEQIYPIAKRILSDCCELSEMFKGKEHLETLSVGASTVPAQYLLPKYLADFRKKHSDIRCELRCGDSAKVHRMLKDGAVRIGLVGAMLEPEHLTYIPIAYDKLVMAVINNDEFAVKKACGVLGRDLLNLPLIMRENGSGTDKAFRDYIKSIGVSENELNIIARVNDTEAIKKMVAQGMGAAVMSELAANSDAAHGDILCFDMDENPLIRTVYTAYKSDIHLNDTEVKFLDFLKK